MEKITNELYESKLNLQNPLKQTFRRQTQSGQFHPGAVIPSLGINANLKKWALENGLNLNQGLGALSPWRFYPERQIFVTENTPFVENENRQVENSNDSDSSVYSEDANDHSKDSSDGESVETENSKEGAKIAKQVVEIDDNSVRSNELIPKKPNKRSFDLVGICSIPIQKKRSEKRSRKASTLGPYPSRPGTEHPVHVIVYQIRDVEGDIYFLLDWSAPDWVGGPTYVKKTDDMCPILVRKHLRDKARYDEWRKGIHTLNDFIWETYEIVPLICTLELKQLSDDEKKVIQKFEERFLNGHYSVALDSEDFLWHSWHVYNFNRFVRTRLNHSDRPEGDARNYGFMDYLRICRHLGEKKKWKEFGTHEEEK